VAAYIYGSVARGDCVESSDVDVHIVLKDNAKIKNMPHVKWIRDVKVDISPHPLIFYKIPPEWILKNINTAAKWEGLWETEKIIILYDPQNIVSSFKEKITPIIHDKRLLRARAQISLEAAINGTTKVEEKLMEESLGQAISYMYSLRGGEGYSGVAPQLLKTVIKFSGLPLTVRRIWIRFKEACNKLNMPEIYELLRKCYGMNQLERENLQEVIDKVYYLIKKIIMNSLISEKTIHDLQRFRLALSEFLESGEIEAAHVYLLGTLSANYLNLKLPEKCREHVKLELERSMCKIAGLYEAKELKGRIEIAQRAINILKRKLRINPS